MARQSSNRESHRQFGARCRRMALSHAGSQPKKLEIEHGFHAKKTSDVFCSLELIMMGSTTEFREPVGFLIHVACFCVCGACVL